MCDSLAFFLNELFSLLTARRVVFAEIVVIIIRSRMSYCFDEFLSTLTPHVFNTGLSLCP